MNARSVALLATMMVAAGGIVAFGFTEPAYALSTPSITTSQQPGSATVGSTIADKATVSDTLYTCPSSDQLDFPVGTNDTSTNPIFCSYPAVSGEDPNDFYCKYDANTGALVTDFDAGLCPGTAVSTGGADPTGSVTFKLYDNSTASGTPLYTDTENLVSGSATSAGYSTTGTGTDYWVATYSGDSNNNSVASSDSGEPVTVNQASPTVSTTASSGSVPVGQSISDKATVSGGDNPTGTVTFNLYSNNACLGTALFTDTENLVSGSATSAGYSTTATGADYWVATYNGDSNNNNNSSSCTADEPVTINPAATAPPQNVAKPWITGTTKVGQVLTSHLGTWTNATNLKYSRQWQRCPATGSGKCTNLPDYKTTYTLTSADAGHKITVVIMATDNHNQSQLAGANRVGPVTN